MYTYVCELVYIHIDMYEIYFVYRYVKYVSMLSMIHHVWKTLNQNKNPSY